MSISGGSTHSSEVVQISVNNLRQFQNYTTTSLRNTSTIRWGFFRAQNENFRIQQKIKLSMIYLWICQETSLKIPLQMKKKKLLEFFVSRTLIFISTRISMFFFCFLFKHTYKYSLRFFHGFKQFWLASKTSKIKGKPSIVTSSM